MTLDLDWRLRLAAFAALRTMMQRRGGVVTSDDLETGFQFEGERIRFWNPRKGIWRPRQLGDGPALSVYTAAPRPDRPPRYEDRGGLAEDRFVYKYEGQDPSLWTNVAVRRAMEWGRPIIYLLGVTPGKYSAVFPCSVVGDKPVELEFELMAEPEARDPVAAIEDPSTVIQRGYATVAAKVRLNQQRFRELVVSAYRVSCAMCQLRHDELLDAAHILPDSDKRGAPEVPNGLCLCKIHHAAYDADIVGVDPDYEVHVRTDVLEEKDGPMLRYGLQEMAGLKLHVPRVERLRPARDHLDERFRRFKAA